MILSIFFFKNHFLKIKLLEKTTLKNKIQTGQWLNPTFLSQNSFSVLVIGLTEIQHLKLNAYLFGIFEF